MKWLDEFLDRFTMYRLMLYYLIGLVGVAVMLSTLGLLQHQPLDILFSTAFLVAVCWISNKLFAYVFEAPTNVESPLITGLILALIITSSHGHEGLAFLAAAGGLAIASKYLLAIHRRHVFNPAAIAVVLTSLGAGDSASWWVGTAWMLPFVLLLGVPLMRRLRRSGMVMVFVLVALAVTAVLALLLGADLVATLQKEVLSSALFFAGFVMLTEPLTSPTTRGKQLGYAAFVGLLFAPQVHVLGVYSTPELALLLGNALSWLISPRAKVLLQLLQRQRLTPSSEELVFASERPLTFRPGQYMECTLQHPHTDTRGARRYFSLASSPTESMVRIAVKYYQPGSSYKRALRELTAEIPLVASQIGGDFTLPKDPAQPLVFIAGGIGITPFRSMVKYLADTKQLRTIHLLYAANSADEFAYRDFFDREAALVGLRTSYLTRRITPTDIKRVGPDLRHSLFYIAGPQAMVVDVEQQLRKLNVPRRHIKKDFFSGYT